MKRHTSHVVLTNQIVTYHQLFLPTTRLSRRFQFGTTEGAVGIPSEIEHNYSLSAGVI